MTEITDFASALAFELINRLGYNKDKMLGNHIIDAVCAARDSLTHGPKTTPITYPMATFFEGHSEQEIRVAFAALKWAKNCAMPVLKYYDAQNAGTWKRTMAQQVIDDAPQEIK